MKIKYFLLFILLILLIVSCKKETETTKMPKTNKGFFIVNEGNFTWGNSSLSFFDEEHKTVENDIFFKANQVTLGDVAFDMKIINNKGFISVNNSGVIYVVNTDNSKHLHTISGFVSPRYILPIDDTLAYVSDLYSQYITIIHTKKLNIYGNIFVGKSTEAMVKVQNKVFVTSWSFNNIVYVINTQTHKVIDSITVGKQPQSIAVDKNNDIWILCDGGYAGNPIGHEEPSLWKINSSSHQIIKLINFPTKNFMARSLTINSTKDTIAFIYNNVYRMAISDTVFPFNYWIASNNSNFYALWHHPIKPWIVVSDAKNFVIRGSIYVYSLNKQLQYNFEAGIIPSAFCYKD